MRIEHIGLGVNNPIAMGKWYEKNLGFRILRELGSNTEGVIFMEDDKGSVIEIAHIPEMPSLEFKSMNPLLIHLAIECSDPIEEANRLVGAGAEMIGEAIRNDYKGEKILVRDPFGGLTIQLVNRMNSLKKN
jgi:hypothetical protein